MRILHTADWHLGKSLRGYALLDDQHFIMNELLRLIDDVKPQAVVIAGDIYDRGIPPADAVVLLSEILTKIVLERKIMTLAIAGNHDSGNRLAFGGEILAQAGLVMRGVLDMNDAPVIVRDEYGQVAFTLFPYFEPGAVDNKLRLDADAATAQVTAAALARVPQHCRSIAVAHLFAAGGVTSESERPLNVGGETNVAPAHFSAFDYTALGHLHAPQRAGADNIRYSGSPLKYSFDEAMQKKGAVLVELAADGKTKSEFLPLDAKRDVRVVEGYMEEIRRDRKRYPVSDDYILVRLLDKTAILSAYDKLTEVYSHLGGIEFSGLTYEPSMGEAQERRKNVSETDLFADFYYEMTGEGLSAKQEQIVAECVREIYRAESEDDDATVDA